jgi:hypothetical protein
MFATLENIDDVMDIRTTWEIIRENITISTKEILGNEEEIEFG